MSLRRQVFTAALVALAAGAALPSVTLAQVRGSERGQVSQVSDGTEIVVDYARPLVRDRDPVFGGLVGWGHTWTPGGNEATTFENSKDVTLNGVTVPAGRYSVWMVPSEDNWEFVLDPNDLLYHTQEPPARPEQIRFEVTPEVSEFTEALSFDFPLVRSSGMDLRFRWATTSILVQIDVEPTAVGTISSAEAAPLVGTYEMTFEGPPPEGAPPGAGPTMQVEIRYDGERLLGTITGGPPGTPDDELMFLPVAESVFNPAWMEDGEVFETEVDMYFEFVFDGNTATGFDVRGLEDRLMMRGRRSN